MNKKISKIARNIAVFGIISAVTTLSNIVPVSANNNIEAELNAVINNYKGANIVVEDGISLRKGESLDLSEYPNWELSNENTVSISENGVVTPINSGTVFLSQEIDGNVHIIEVYVPSKAARYNSNTRNTVVNRDYYKVFVDAGHGGSDPGALGNGLEEEALNLQVATKVEAKLKEKGIEVKMSRTSDNYISLQERAEMANAYEADVFVSIHQNSASADTAEGIETYRHRDKEAHNTYASDIQNNLIKETSAKNRGVKTANFAVLRETNMTAALVENGFINNPNEAAKLSDPNYQDKLATGIANGIEKYLKENIELEKPEEEKPPVTPEVPEKPPVTPEVPEKPPVTPEVPEKPPVTKIGTITASSLNVRSGYGTSYSKIGSLKKGAKVEIVETKNGWHKIKFNSGYGYISGDYVSINSSNNDNNTNKPPVTNPIVTKTGAITASSLNVRSGYGTSYSKIGSLKKGAKVEIVETKNGWHKIKFNSGYGYISGDYVSINSSNNDNNTNKPPVTNPIVTKTGTITASSLNVRSGYGTSYSKIGSLKKGAKVEIVESKNGWHKIKFNSGYGYISGDYVSINSSNNDNNTNKPPVTNPIVTKTGTITASSLNVRSGYGTSYSKIGSLKKGAKVEIVESKNGWHKIKFNSGYGYISGDYVSINSSNNNSQTTNPGNVKTGTVTASSLNVRSGYGTNYSKIGSLKKGAKVEIVESKNGWHKIKYGNRFGYVSAEYISAV